MIGRRTFLAAGAGALAAAAVPGRGPKLDDFVHRAGNRLTLEGRAYRFAGSNMWYAAYLGAVASCGDRSRLRRELDSLAALGVTNLRILASSELSPLRNSVRPAFRSAGPRYDETLLRGLDFALADMGRRGMRAVLYLTNFWEWSGGMMTYLSWVNGGHYVNMNDPAHPWPEFPDMAAAFYAEPRAVALYRDYVRAIVGRTNSVTGRRYADDPTIMAWQLANEPRPGGSDKGARANMPAYDGWIRDTARLIKTLDPHHLVSTGSEGLKGCVEDEACVLHAHAPPDIDYLTAHVWPLNWGWVDAADLPGTWAGCEAKVRDYLAVHRRLAATLAKPLVIEEFGFPRDGGGYDPGTPTRWKDRFYGLVYEAVAADPIIAGANFWAWGGEGRAGAPGHKFRLAPGAFVGDPPHEPQGWYSVFDGDESTKAVIAAHAGALQAHAG